MKIEENLDKYYTEEKIIYNEVKENKLTLPEVIERCTKLWELVPTNYHINPIQLNHLVEEKFGTDPDFKKYKKVYYITVNSKSNPSTPFGYLNDVLENTNVKITFGLQPHHIETIEKELERFGNREVNAKYVKYIWEKLGKELAWEPFSLALYYFEYLDNKHPK